MNSRLTARLLAIRPRRFLSGTLLLWAATACAHDGTVNIDGTILNNTCTISSESKNITVPMGMVASKQFYKAGDTTNPIQFSINLENCGSAVSGVDVTFTGATDTANKDLLAIDTGTGNATGLGIALLDQNKTLIPISEPSKQYALTPDAKSVSLVFFAQYTATGAKVSAGVANATATFTLNYA
ncbi:fimbrial protein [Lelliottia wanjuensis]|uniref:fimbrial protein n=1 Tax=Lelliottia wanjuensis TaxID=3050585 RepID=UPI00254CDD04|nr:fimbrial protein [Lelliottia sp. V104_15]MDK9604844.1 fimbrial protein [Lelliottia sp. V104_15]